MALNTHAMRLSIKNKDLASDLMFLYECIGLLEREKSCLGERNKVYEEGVQIYIYYILGKKYIFD